MSKSGENRWTFALIELFQNAPDGLMFSTVIDRLQMQMRVAHLEEALAVTCNRFQALG